MGNCCPDGTKYRGYNLSEPQDVNGKSNLNNKIAQTHHISNSEEQKIKKSVSTDQNKNKILRYNNIKFIKK